MLTTRDQRTATLLKYYDGLPDEFQMLTGVLCAQHALWGKDADDLDAIFDFMKIAARMDAINAAALKRAGF